MHESRHPVCGATQYLDQYHNHDAIRQSTDTYLRGLASQAAGTLLPTSSPEVMQCNAGSERGPQGSLSARLPTGNTLSDTSRTLSVLLFSSLLFSSHPRCGTCIDVDAIECDKIVGDPVVEKIRDCHCCDILTEGLLLCGVDLGDSTLTVSLHRCRSPQRPAAVHGDHGDGESSDDTMGLENEDIEQEQPSSSAVGQSMGATSGGSRQGQDSHIAGRGGWLAEEDERLQEVGNGNGMGILGYCTVSMPVEDFGMRCQQPCYAFSHSNYHLVVWFGGEL